jgi:hypothetical protein
MALINKGLNHDLHFKHKQWIKNLVVDAESALCYQSPSEQDPIRHLIAINIKHLYTHLNKSNNIVARKKIKLATLIREEKHDENIAILGKADKGNTIVLLNKP